MDRLVRFLNSSIGKKFSMAVTGLLLIGFLVTHLLGNLTLYADDTGEMFNAYEHALTSNPLLPIAEVGLLVLFVIHIALGIRVTLENRESRKSDYQIRSTKGARTLASGSMIITGVLVLVFLVVHLKDFRIAKMGVGEHDMALMVKERLASPVGALIYLIGVGALGIHLSHAFKGALQTLGVSHPRYTPLIEKASLALAVLLFLGFASFPLILWLG